MALKQQPEEQLIELTQKQHIVILASCKGSVCHEPGAGSMNKWYSQLKNVIYFTHFDPGNSNAVMYIHICAF